MRDLENLYIIGCYASLRKLADEPTRSLPIFKGSRLGLAANQVSCLDEIAAREWLAKEGVGIDYERIRCTGSG